MSEWISKKYLDEEWYGLFKKHANKKIICFGAGTALYTIPRFLPPGIEIAYYIDSHYEDWEQNPVKAVVKHPGELMNEKPGSFLVLIGGQHTISMKEQLEGYGLVEDVDFFNAYEKYERAMRLGKVDYQTDKLIDFINQIPNGALEKTPEKGKKIGVVMTCTFLAPQVFDIGLYLLLRYKGYDVELIVDDIYNNENKSIYEGITADIKELDNKVLNHLKSRFADCRIKYMSDFTRSELADKDKNCVEEAAHANAVWQRSRKIQHVIEVSEEQWQELFYDILDNNLQYIKGFFEENKYDIITIFTGIHSQRYFYPYIGEKQGMRVVTYDGTGLIPKWSVNGACSAYNDVTMIIKDKLFSDRETMKIVELAREHFEKRINTVTDGREGYDFQTRKNGKVTLDWYDVIIPLNLMWDAAALGRNRIFAGEKEWVLETIDYILYHTDANILVREHPDPNGIRTRFYNTDSYQEIIEERYKGNERVFFADKLHELNTYEYIQNCKLVLPFTSTVGIEAALMGKKVLVHAKVYYNSLDFVETADDKEEYFRQIKYWLENTYDGSNDLVQAYMAYYLGMNYGKKCIFNETSPEWMDVPISVIAENPDVNVIIRAITDGVPVGCFVVKEKLQEERTC